jgi:chromosome segregation ATPase
LTAHRIRSGHWLRSGGPFQAEIVERAEHALEDVEPLFEALSEAEQRNVDLDAALNDTNTLLEHLSGLLQEAQLENDRLLEENERLRLRASHDEDPSPEG